MKFHDKLMELRRQKGWSQEELADRLNVTRQSVSKWESAASLPDLEKIVAMSTLFGVSTDYLLKEETDREPAFSADAPEEKTRFVTLIEARDYWQRARKGAGRIALGILLCILSPAPLLLLKGWSEQPNSTVTESMAAGLGVGLLLLLVGAAVFLFVAEGMALSHYDFLEQENIHADALVKKTAEEEKAAFEPTLRRSVALGVLFCVLAVVPVVVVGGFLEHDALLMMAMVSLLLLFVAVGVFLLTRSGMVRDSFDKLLEAGEYTREKKRENRRNAPIAAIYWGLVTAAYLAWSFITFDWARTWIVWPVAGVCFGVLMAVVNACRRKK